MKISYGTLKKLLFEVAWVMSRVMVSPKRLKGFPESQICAAYNKGDVVLGYSDVTNR